MDRERVVRDDSEHTRSSLEAVVYRSEMAALATGGQLGGRPLVP